MTSMRGEYVMLAVLGDAHDAHASDAHEQLAIIRREGEATAETAKICDYFRLTRWIDPVNLPRFPARPEVAIAIECAAFRVIQSAGKHFKTSDGDFRVHQILFHNP